MHTRLVAAAALAALVATACSGGRQGANPAADPTSSVVAPSTTEDSSTTSSTTTSTTTTTRRRTTTSTSTTTTVPEPEGLRSGVEGPEVLALQQRLTELGYWLGDRRRHLRLPHRAGGHGLPEGQRARPRRHRRARRPSRPSRPPPARRRSVLADGIEIDLERQLLFVVRGGQVLYALNTSTGTSGWRTPPGDFTVVRRGRRDAPRAPRRPVATEVLPRRDRHPRRHPASPRSRRRTAAPACRSAAMDMVWADGPCGDRYACRGLLMGDHVQG